jgi:hypothetical protein
MFAYEPEKTVSDVHEAIAGESRVSRTTRK